MNDDLTPTAILLETQYLPSASVFVMLRSFSEVRIDVDELFRKSTTRNRCTIMGANGRLLLTIPVEGGRSVKKPVKDVRINNGEPWQRNHWGSIFSSYGRSAYFEFYEDLFKPFYERRTKFLVDFNIELMTTCLEILHIKSCISKTGSMESLQSENVLDTRNKKMKEKSNIPYYQVFSEKHGFVADLSILDLIFNLGPDSASYLGKMSDN